MQYTQHQIQLRDHLIAQSNAIDVQAKVEGWSFWTLPVTDLDDLARWGIFSLSDYRRFFAEVDAREREKDDRRSAFREPTSGEHLRDHIR